MKTQLPPLTEYAECCLLAEYLDRLKQQGKIILYSHIPNGTWTPSWSQKVRNKKMGVSSGVPDYLIVTNGRAFFIEMKRKKGGRQSDEQKVWQLSLINVGIEAHLAYGFDEAKVIVDALI
jgi:predicted type IV restriction endonuclease